MKRRKHGSAVSAATQAFEMQRLAPAIMARRLTQLHGRSPVAATFEWSRWAFEKQFAFALSGLAFAQGCAQAMLSGSAATAGETQAHAARTAANMLAPLHRRVKRNARRKRG